MELNLLLSLYRELPEFIGIRITRVDQASAFGDMPMNVAATRGSIEELETLLGAGADVNSAGEHGYTPLHNAVEQGKYEAVEWLLRHGAHRGIRNEAGETPGQLASLLGETEIAAHLSDRE
ncbi:ankyrin repeat domain-containing protein [Stenotrophomonas sp. HMWF003]|uniref:ankyrin repeat domain-containing protein n=1 Tax=Stenotrophomonas sp. HMWF003 TaxID=2056840 RepID=UPI000D4BFCD7|nr:ankyrin repeat domain-containing protein [Stenotrophomonas sp. HMWF003]PTT58947.1 ankyrin repeat domain-containing protein [Stenotrophomonas sp. HMWF003]